MAGGIAVLFVVLSLPLFDRLLGRTIDLSLLARADVILAAAGVVLFVAFVSGAYPALLLSSWDPVPILKGAAQSGGRGSTALRNGLVCMQFAVSIALLAGTFVVTGQMRYIEAKDLGFRKDHILSAVAAFSPGLANPEPFRNEILKNPRVLDFTSAGIDPSYIGSGGPQKLADGRELVFYRATGDAHFLDFFGMKIIRGRNFSPEYPSDERESLIINETAAEALGWEDPIGRLLLTDGRIPKGRIIGVVRDFHFHPLRLPIMPLWFRQTTSGNAHFFIKVDSRDLPATVRFLETAWKKFSPDFPFAYSFLEDNLERLYADERAFSALFGALAGLAAFLACLGLVGLSTFTVERRMREIGIRRVLGASRPGIAALLSQGFLKWVLIAAAIALPVAFLAGRSWLNRFAYRVEMGVVPFAAALGAAMGLALLSVAVQSLRAGSADPARILRRD
jgi:putative ABC transport system permease protein